MMSSLPHGPTWIKTAALGCHALWNPVQILATCRYSPPSDMVSQAGQGAETVQHGESDIKEVMLLS